MRKSSILGTMASNYKRKATTEMIRAGYKALGGTGNSPRRNKKK